MTEEAAKRRARRSKVGRFPSSATAGHRHGRAEGMIKTVFDAKTGELLGASHEPGRR
jgi:dihydrolipoamide dehydrogenase